MNEATDCVSACIQCSWFCIARAIVYVQPPSEATASVESEDEDQEVQQPAKMSRFHKAQLQAQQLAEEKAKRREEAAKRAAEKEQAIAKRKRVHRQLSKKTRAGQPVMGNKIQHLLGKIQEQKQKEGQQA